MSLPSENVDGAVYGAIGPSKTSQVYKNLRINPIKALYKYYTPHNVNLAGGIPLESCFPFQSMKVDLDGPEEDSYCLTKGKDLYLNYQMGDGIPALKSWIKAHVAALHNPPHAYDACPTVGATDSWFKLLMLLNSDCVLFDQYVYGASMTPCHTLGKRAIGVPSDSEGIIPAALREAVHLAREKGLLVNILYLIPVGHNPMGVTISQQRRRELYALCQELDLIIVEDDAYYYLYYPDGELPGLRDLPRSMLSLDTDGRVIRIDSFAKIIAPGLRVGFITGPPDFVAKYVLLQSQSCQFPSSVSQSMLLGLVQHWGEAGLHSHLLSLQAHYRSQRDVFVQALDQYMPSGTCTYTRPTGGMFFWLTFPTLGHVTTHQLFEAFAKADVIAAPGTGFYVPGIHEVLAAEGMEGYDQAVSEKSVPCFRACYAAARADRLVDAVKAMAKCVVDLSAGVDMAAPAGSLTEAAP